jgi:YHS domain-containing protein
MCVAAGADQGAMAAMNPAAQPAVAVCTTGPPGPPSRSAGPEGGRRPRRTTTIEHRQTENGTYCFCSAHCAATFDAARTDPAQADEKPAELTHALRRRLRR